MSDARWKAARALAAAGDATGALRELREALRRDELGPERRERAGALARKLFDGTAEGTCRVAILGESSTQWLANSTVAAALSEGVQLAVHEGEYDNVLQELHGPHLEEFSPAVVVLVPWHRASDSAGMLSERTAHWAQIQSTVTRKSSAGIVQVGFDWVDPGPFGYHLATAPGGAIDSIRRANQALRGSLPPGSYFVDMPAVSGDLGRRSFYDPRRYHWTKQPYSEAGVDWLARHVWAGIRALVTGPKKVLVLDLDGTLWGGVVGEVGPLGVELGESPAGAAFRDIQGHAKALASRGVLLTVSSKNNDADARGPFGANPDMILSLDDVAAFEASWDPKSRTMHRMAERLRLGSDSFVFLDDNPTEREEVRQNASGVAVVETPTDPAEYARALTRELWFEAVSVTGEDASRTQQYVTEAKRASAQAEHQSLDGFLESLDLRAEVRAVDEPDMQRVVQLIGKTNQFNLTNRRHSRSQVEQLLATDRAFGMTLRLRDRFGDHGLTLVILGRPRDAESVEIDTFLMSCRVIARTVEEFAWRKVVAKAAELSYRRIIGVFRPSPKNGLVADLYPRLGMIEEGSTEEERRFVQEIEGATLPATFVRDP